MGAVRPSDVRSWVARLVAAGYVTSTIRGVFNTGAQVFAQAVDDGVIARSPCAGMRAGELAALRVERTNLLARTIDVTESRGRGSHRTSRWSMRSLIRRY